ncbi:hypothetical protein CHS0354_030540 [Potamilus streckersoni]|uniref:Uncharacterized protein n=1 Tax=Potamilus streckersoni TaxID=2493646 RepID=A0AAE0RQ46_9BIVA|nr:hypothetical protein CHS0354_030540 [Potamilus streckersoni]
MDSVQLFHDSSTQHDSVQMTPNMLAVPNSMPAVPNGSNNPNTPVRTSSGRVIRKPDRLILELGLSCVSFQQPSIQFNSVKFLQWTVQIQRQ